MIFLVSWFLCYSYPIDYPQDAEAPALSNTISTEPSLFLDFSMTLVSLFWLLYWFSAWYVPIFISILLILSLKLVETPWLSVWSGLPCICLPSFTPDSTSKIKSPSQNYNQFWLATSEAIAFIIAHKFNKAVMQCFPCIVCSYVILLCLILQLESGLNIAGWCCNLSLIAGGSIMDYFSPLKFSTTKFER